MLGCHDFCGYYEWTFHYLRRRFGDQALEKYWRDAVAADAQSHYVQAGQQKGLRGLYECWNQTGEDEQCDWTVSLDEDRNSLRLDMRQCPSKGFLLDNDLNANEDYCDHCMGWIGPALETLGAEVVAHEHNHCGQCWWQMGLKDLPSRPANEQADICRDVRWQHGYLHRFVDNRKVSAESENSFADPVAAIQGLFASVDDVLEGVFESLARTNVESMGKSSKAFTCMLTDDPIVRASVLGRNPLVSRENRLQCMRSENTLLVIGDGFDSARDGDVVSGRTPSIATEKSYLALNLDHHQPSAVLLGCDGADWQLIASKWNSTSPNMRPLLLHPFLPGLPPVPFTEFGLVRPLPILLLLVRNGLYAHQPNGPYPTTSMFCVLLAVALEKNTIAVGIDLTGDSFGRSSSAGNSNHSVECDQMHLSRARDRSRRRLELLDQS